MLVALLLRRDRVLSLLTRFLRGFLQFAGFTVLTGLQLETFLEHHGYQVTGTNINDGVILFCAFDEILAQGFCSLVGAAPEAPRPTDGVAADLTPSPIPDRKPAAPA